MEDSHSLSEFERAYKKLKASVYYEKASVVLCRKLAEYEASPSFIEQLGKLEDTLKNANDKSWKEYVGTLVGQIGFFAFPKKMKDVTDARWDQEEKTPKCIYNYSPSSSEIRECQFFIDMPVEAHLLGVLWVMRIGVYLDEKLSDDVYGNRVRRAKDSKSRVDDSTPYLFKPYFGQYRKWRDKAIEVAERAANDDSQNVYMLSLDFKSFFYRVRFTKEEWNRVLLNSEQKCLKSEIDKRLHEFCFSVFKRYAEVLFVETKNDDYREASSILPIGFAPSLIASNWCLHKFDEEVVRQIDPLYYGRYVDDILIVKRNYDDQEQFELESFLENFLADCSSSGGTKLPENNCNELVIGSDFLEAAESRIAFQQQKTKVFFFSAQAPQALLLRLKEEILKNSSEFRLMPDIFGMTIEDSYASIFDYQFNGSPNKIRDIENIELDKFGLSKYLGCMQKVLPVLEDSRKTTLLTELVNFLDNCSLIDCYIYWERIIEIVVCASLPNLLNKLITKIADAINKLRFIKDSDSTDNSDGSAERQDAEEDLNMSFLLKISLHQFLASAALRASALINDDAIDAVIKRVYSSQPLSFADEIISLDDKEDDSSEYLKVKCAFWKTQLLNASVVPVLPAFVPAISVFFGNGQRTNFSKFEDIKRILSLAELEFGNCTRLLPYVVKTQDIEYSIYVRRIACGDDINDACTIHNQAKSIYDSLNFYKSDDDEVCSVKEISISSSVNQDSTARKSSDLDGNYCINVASNKHLDSGRIRVAVANMQLNEDDISLVLKQKQKVSFLRYEDLRQLTTDAKRCEADMLVLPEASVPISLLPFLITFSEKENIAIVCGIEHVLGGGDQKKVYNLTATILPYRDKKDEWEFAKLTLHQKVYFSPTEKKTIVDHDYTCAEGSTFELYAWRNIWFPVYCCFELTSIQSRALFQSYADLIVVPIWNKDVHYYEHIEYSLSRDLTCFCVQANNAKYGDSCIIQPDTRVKSTLLRVKGGVNTTVLAADLDIKKLRDAQVTRSGEKFKPTSPDFNLDIAIMKNNGSLLDHLKGKDFDM